LSSALPACSTWDTPPFSLSAPIPTASCPRGRCSRRGLNSGGRSSGLAWLSASMRTACRMSCISPSRSGSQCRFVGSLGAFFGVLFGAPTLRLRGDYLAIVTLGFGEIVPIVARNTPYLTNGAIGLNGAAPPRLFGHSFGAASSPYYYLGLLMVGALVFVSLRLLHSRV